MITPRELLESLYGFADANAWAILAISLLVPLIGIGLAWVGRGGRTDADGKAFANAFIFVATLQFVIALVVGYAGAAFLERGPFDTDIRLLAAPFLWLGLSIVGLKQVFPLSELTSWDTVKDVGLFLLAGAVFMWLLSMFRGWGIFFVGGLVQMVLILAFAVWLLRTLFVRAFRGDGPED